MSPTEPAPTWLAQSPATAEGLEAVCVAASRSWPTGISASSRDLIHPEAANREAADEPMAARGGGPAAFYATALWLRGAFSDLRWEMHEIAADGDLVAVHSTMSGRHTGPFVHYDGAGAVSQAMPPTGGTFSATQTHWFRHAGGKVIEHWANRDDLATAQQAGWIPRSPRYLVRMALAKRRARAATNA